MEGEDARQRAEAEPNEWEHQHLCRLREGHALEDLQVEGTGPGPAPEDEDGHQDGGRANEEHQCQLHGRVLTGTHREAAPDETEGAGRGHFVATAPDADEEVHRQHCNLVQKEEDEEVLRDEDAKHP